MSTLMLATIQGEQFAADKKLGAEISAMTLDLLTKYFDVQKSKATVLQRSVPREKVSESSKDSP